MQGNNGCGVMMSDLAHVLVYIQARSRDMMSNVAHDA
jgi:hypothetical protein